MKHSTFASPFFRGARFRSEFRTDAPLAAEVDAPLAALRGSDLSRRFRHWRGMSGRRYLFSVFPLGAAPSLDRCPRFDAAVVLAVKRGPDDGREILYLDQTGSVPDLVFEGTQLKAAIAAGANEIHVHLLTECAEGRLAILCDLAG